MQLFRKEVAKRQKEMLQISLQRLENVTYSARSSSEGEAAIRTADAQLLAQFIERAKDIEPLGQVVLGKNRRRDKLILQNYDRVLIPAKSMLVSVSGEVMFPGATVWEKDWRVADYIDTVGGFSQRDSNSRVVVIQRDGSIRTFDGGRRELDDKKAFVLSGDEILVIPQPDKKKMQFAIDISQILYQIALTARVAVLL